MTTKKIKAAIILILMGRISKWIDRIIAWLGDHVPVNCYLCRSWFWKKDVKYHQHNTGMMMPLCRKCEDDVFHPYSNSKRGLKHEGR